MRRARERIEAGGEQVSHSARDELAALEKRYAIVKQQLSDLETQADQRAAKLRKETKAAVESLKKDLDHLVDGLKR
jgi:hypothetical protein